MDKTLKKKKKKAGTCLSIFYICKSKQYISKTMYDIYIHIYIILIKR